MEFNAEQIASFLSGTVEGNKDVTVNNFSKIESGKKNTITFLANLKYEQFIYDTNASIVLVNNDFKASKPIKATLIRVENAYECLAKLLTLASKAKPRKQGIENPVHIADSAKQGENLYIGAFAYIGENTTIGDNTQIYPQVYISDNVTIGKDCILYPGVKIYDNCIVGNNCILQAGCVIGGDGFGFAPNEKGEYDKIPQLGNVVLEDFVEIGANTTIDRAVMESTRIHKGTKLDNLIQIAHNVEIGSNTVMAAQVGVAGSTKIGSNCMVGGQVGFAGHITIADGAQFAAQAGVPNSIKNVKTPYMGTPALPIKNFAKSTILFKKFPEIYNNIKKNTSAIEDLKK